MVTTVLSGFGCGGHLPAWFGLVVFQCGGHFPAMFLVWRLLFCLVFLVCRLLFCLVYGVVATFLPGLFVWCLLSAWFFPGGYFPADSVGWLLYRLVFDVMAIGVVAAFLCRLLVWWPRSCQVFGGVSTFLPGFGVPAWFWFVATFLPSFWCGGHFPAWWEVFSVWWLLSHLVIQCGNYFPAQFFVLLQISCRFSVVATFLQSFWCGGYFSAWFWCSGYFSAWFFNVATTFLQSFWCGGRFPAKLLVSRLLFCLVFQCDDYIPAQFLVW